MNKIIETLEARYAEINVRAQQYSLSDVHDPGTRRWLYGERAGAREMLNAAKEAAENEKKNANPSLVRAILVHYLYTGEVVPGFEEYFPAVLTTKPGVFATPKPDDNPGSSVKNFG